MDYADDALVPSRRDSRLEPLHVCAGTSRSAIPPSTESTCGIELSSLDMDTRFGHASAAALLQIVELEVRTENILFSYKNRPRADCELMVLIVSGSPYPRFSHKAVDVFSAEFEYGGQSNL